MSNSPLAAAYIVAARRSALGRIGGLHRARRLDELTVPVLLAALADARLAPERVEEIILGNASSGGNPARLIALAAGLPETASASTIDRQCGSGLDAIVAAIRTIMGGEADVMVAGGAESLSTAPWRIAKPKSLHQLPHFIGPAPAGAGGSEECQPVEASEALAMRLGISREAQDAYIVRAHLKAEAARDARRFVREIVPLRPKAEEAHDQVVGEADAEVLGRMPAFLAPTGTLTRGNTSAMCDGAAIAVVVSERIWTELDRPPALRLVASASQGVAPAEEATAPIAAMGKLYGRLSGFDRSSVGILEMSESSAAQAIALVKSLGLDDNVVNPDGGAVVRGHPFGAAGAVLVTRLFTRMARQRNGGHPRYGAATQGAIGGLGLAALFEAV
ncbi:MAG TPA: thiolase family protein [Hyphomicrobiaceae bacterium]|nr:thiolase family protein [Hyphomicrobiaceae bacterium]